MTIELAQLRLLVAAADTGSFTRAADLLITRHATVSRQVAMLEQYLGLTLFDRTTRGVVPTSEGLQFIELARRIVKDADDLRTWARALARGELGRIAIGFCGPLHAGQTLALWTDMAERYPALEVSWSEAEPEELHRLLHTRMIDVAIVPCDITDPLLRRERLWSEQVLLAVSDQHPLAVKPKLFWSDLEDEQIALPRGGIGDAIAELLRPRIAASNAGAGVTRHELSLPNLAGLVRRNRFVSVVPEALLGLAWPGVEFREVQDTFTHARLEYWLRWHPENGNPALKHLFALLKERNPMFMLGPRGQGVGA